MLTKRITYTKAQLDAAAERLGAEIMWDKVVTNSRIRAIRLSLGLTLEAWARALGYSGTVDSLRVSASRLEHNTPIPPKVAKLAAMYEKYGISPSPGEHGINS